MLFSMPIAVVLLKETTSLMTRAKPKPANLIIDVSKAGFYKPSVWANFAQGGEEKVNMFTAISQEIAELQPSYIRIDHVYDFYDVVARDESGRLTYDWSRLDEQVKGILSTGAKPFFSLSYMPEAISRSNEVDIPNNWKEWEEVVQKTVEHYSGFGGLGIRGVYYEVWNEPDLFGGFKLYGDKNYLTLYKFAAQGASNAKNVNPFKFGGPATTALYENWVRNFLMFVRDSDLRIDFYSWHRYSQDMNDFENDLRLLKDLMNEFPEYINLELLISEIGFSSENNEAYDTFLGAIHSLATVAIHDLEIDRLFSFELKDGPGHKKYWGRWGILTHESFGKPEKKPRYYSFEFLNKISGSPIAVEGQGTWVKSMARFATNRLSVLVVNYDASGKNLEAVPIRFVNLPKNNFNFKKIEFLGRETAFEPINTQANEWQTVELLKPNSAYILELDF